MTSNKTKVAHFIRGFLRPTETFIGNQIVSLRKYDPVIFCHHKINNHSFTNLHANALLDIINPIHQKFEKLFYSAFRALTPFGVHTLVNEVIKSDSKILHLHYLVEARFFLPVARQLHLPSVVSGYGWDVSSFPKSKYGFGRQYLQPIFKEMDLFLAMSEDMKKDMTKLGCPESKIKVHYFGTDTARNIFSQREYKNKGVINVLYLGRLTPKKAPQNVLYALKMLEERNPPLPDWRLKIVGDGPLKSDLERIVHEYKWTDKVEFTGHISYDDPRLNKVYHQADIYVLPSMTVNGEKEGIPGSLIEAMASGLPIISTFHAGIPFVVKNRNDGLLVKEGNIDGIADALIELLESSKLRETLGKAAAYKALTQLDIKSQTSALENIYDSLIKTN
jgi:colanic acid/amylovoran biosynthesis glycosyltransferase